MWRTGSYKLGLCRRDKYMGKYWGKVRCKWENEDRRTQILLRGVGGKNGKMRSLFQTNNYIVMVQWQYWCGTAVAKLKEQTDVNGDTWHCGRGHCTGNWGCTVADRWKELGVHSGGQVEGTGGAQWQTGGRNWGCTVADRWKELGVHSGGQVEGTGVAQWRTGGRN